MAATVSAWCKPGSWALDSEENEAQLLQQHEQDTVNGNHLYNGDPAITADFPSLAAAASIKPKKKKGQTLPLLEFTTVGTTAKLSNGPTPDEMLSLPTGPRQRSAEELDLNKLGGEFRSYGNNYDRPSRDEQPRRQRDSNRDFAPSRAVEIDDWAAARKSTAGNGFERRERGGKRGGFFSESQSRADEVDNWASNKTFVPSNGRRNDRRGGGFESNGGGADSANWVQRQEEEGRKFGGAGAFDSSLRERRDYSANADSWGTTTTGGRPRLNLQPRTLPVGEQTESVVKPKGSSPSPFGDARPREEVLKEKGQDWKAIDEKLESAKVKEAAAAVEEKPLGRREVLVVVIGGAACGRSRIETRELGGSQSQWSRVRRI